MVSGNEVALALLLVLFQLWSQVAAQLLIIFQSKGGLPNVLQSKAETKWVFLNASESKNELL